MSDELKTSGFNNLTKVLSFNLYDFCIALNEDQRHDYIEWVNNKYSSQKILDVSQKICELIEADILSTSLQDYDPVGASTLVLMSDIKGGGDWKTKNETVTSKSGHKSMNLHLDKSHITAHTYPDASDPNGICSFRVDIDIATCGEIIPLKAINLLFESFECDVVVIDYVVRGFTRMANGTKIFNDDEFDSIQDFISEDILNMYEHITDLNMGQVNTWQTKLMLEGYPADRFLMEKEDSGNPLVKIKMELLEREMKEVFKHC